MTAKSPSDRSAPRAGTSTINLNDGTMDVAGNVGDPQLHFTALDRTGARVVYGGPFTEFEFAD